MNFDQLIGRLTNDQTKDLFVRVIQELTDDELISLICDIASDSDQAFTDELIVNLEDCHD